MSASRQKGTGGETELKRKLNELGIATKRMPMGCAWDLESEFTIAWPVLEALAVRPDRGEWLVTVRLEDALTLFDRRHLHIEVKRPARSWIHSVWEKKGFRK